MLILAASTIIITTVYNETDSNWMSEEVFEYTILGISTTTTMLAAVFAYVKPVSRWKVLRCVSSELRSAIFQYRTRTGAYGDWEHDERRCVLRRAPCEMISIVAARCEPARACGI